MEKKFWNKTENTNPTSEVGSDCTDIGSPTYPAGKFGNGISATGTNDSTETDDAFTADDLTHYEEWAVGMWVKPGYNIVDGDIATAGGSYNALFSFQPASPVGQALFGAFFQDKLYVIVNDLTVEVTTGMNMTAGTWYYMRFVFGKSGIDGGANTVRVYLDSTLVGTSNSSWTSYTNDDLYLRIANDYPFWYVWDGMIDNVTIWDYANFDVGTRIYEDETYPATAKKIAVFWG
jgi:hypothetical protein